MKCAVDAQFEGISKLGVWITGTTLYICDYL